MYNSVDVVSRLINNNAGVNQIDCLGNTPLHYAARNGACNEILDLLFINGAQINKIFIINYM